MQPCGDRYPGYGEDPNGPSERGNRDRPYADLDAVERDARIYQPEQQ